MIASCVNLRAILFSRQYSSLQALDIPESGVDSTLSKRALHLTDLQSLVRFPPRSLRYFHYTPNIRLNNNHELHHEILEHTALPEMFETLLRAVFPLPFCPVPELNIFPVIEWKKLTLPICGIICFSAFVVLINSRGNHTHSAIFAFRVHPAWLYHGVIASWQENNWIGRR